MTNTGPSSNQLSPEVNTHMRINFPVERGETQKDVNYTVLEYLVNKLGSVSRLKVLDLPCGNMQFLTYLKNLFPDSILYGADIKKRIPPEGIRFVEMDLTKNFTVPTEERFDLITSISGVMMFGNTLSFISNCTERLKKDALFILTNDNASTIYDKLAFLFLGRHRIFPPVYEDTHELTQNISIQELCRLLRVHDVTIDEIRYTSFYMKDLLFLPIAILIYPVQWLYLRRYKTGIPDLLKKQMFPFKHYFCKHYIIFGRKN